MDTSGFGGFNIELYDNEAPQTVANFLKYMNKGPADEGGYDFTIIHRRAKTYDATTDTNVPFIIQGGGYACCIINNPVHIGTDLPIPNEFSPSRSNTRGTIAMAKLGGDPDSATSEWFINLRDNSENLDNQNGGFTVFAKVLDPGMDVVDKIADQDVINNRAAFDEKLNPTSINNVPWVKNDFIYITRVCINSDGDGACPEIENLAPNNGDGNGDGIPDRNQKNVTTILTQLGFTATIASDNVMKFDSVISLDNDTALLKLASFKSPQDYSAQFNNGIFSFLMTGVMGGASHVITLFDGATVRPTRYYAYGPTPDNSAPHWYNFAFDGITGAEIMSDRIVLHFVDGMRGDDDRTANNSITHTGGQVVLTSLPPSSTGSGGCTITTSSSQAWRNGDWALVAVFLVVLALVRKRIRRNRI